KFYPTPLLFVEYATILYDVTGSDSLRESAMKGIDYTKQLHKDREYFQNTIKKTQESAEKRIADNDERTQSIVGKQRNNFIEDKAELESNYQNNLEALNEKTRSSLN